MLHVNRHLEKYCTNLLLKQIMLHQWKMILPDIQGKLIEVDVSLGREGRGEDIGRQTQPYFKDPQVNSELPKS